jgi:hypothetical protein
MVMLTPMKILAAFGLCAVSSIATADPAKDITKEFETAANSMVTSDEVPFGPPKFAITDSSADAAPEGRDALTDFSDLAAPEKVVVGVAADGKSAWFASDVGYDTPCGDESCDDNPKHHDETFHTTILWEGGAGTWEPVAWHDAGTVTAKAQAAVMKKGRPTYDAIARQVDAGAGDAVKLFESSIGDPAALAKTVSDRKDVVMYGSASGERFVGGKKVAATLTKWKLGFTVIDGVAAGATKSGTVAWVAANVDARSMKKKGVPGTPYRALFIYEKTGADWKLVQLHFSFAD